MTAPEGLDPEGPDKDLADLYALFKRLWRKVPEESRRQLAFDVVLHPAAMKRLSAAANRVRRRLVRGGADFDELVQEALLRLVRTLSAETLPFRDLGIRRFACWYWTLCTNASLEALQKCNRGTLPSLDDVEEDDLPLVPAVMIAQQRWEEVLSAISQIRHPLLQIVMADMAAGIKERESAEANDVSTSTVSKMRQRGLDLLRSRCRKETVTQD